MAAGCLTWHAEPRWQSCQALLWAEDYSPGWRLECLQRHHDISYSMLFGLQYRCRLDKQVCSRMTASCLPVFLSLKRQAEEDRKALGDFLALQQKPKALLSTSYCQTQEAA